MAVKPGAAEATFTAPEVAGLNSVEAIVNGKTYWVNLNVIAPAEVRFRIMQTDKGTSAEHEQNNYATGMVLNTYFMPDYVSFDRLWVNELNATAQGTGALSLYNQPHCTPDATRPLQDNACEAQPVLPEVLPSFGSRLGGPDCVYFQHYPTPSEANSTGKATLKIGHEYRVGETGRPHSFGPPTEQSIALTARRELIVGKGNAAVKVLLEAPTDTFSCLQSEGKHYVCGAEPLQPRTISCKDVPYAPSLPAAHK